MISKHLSRDIYYAKYYGKGGGENGQPGKEKRRKITLKKGEKALKMHLFGPARRKLISRGKK